MWHNGTETGTRIPETGLSVSVYVIENAGVRSGGPRMGLDKGWGSPLTGRRERLRDLVNPLPFFRGPKRCCAYCTRRVYYTQTPCTLHTGVCTVHMRETCEKNETAGFVISADSLGW